MGQGKRPVRNAAELSDRGMSVRPCPVGTGVVIVQQVPGGQPFTIHLTLTEAKELASQLVDAVREVRQGMGGLKTARSLYAEGKRLDEIAHALNMTVDEVKHELAACKILKDLDGL